jgi:hypothetical protein
LSKAIFAPLCVFFEFFAVFWTQRAPSRRKVRKDIRRPIKTETKIRIESHFRISIFDIRIFLSDFDIRYSDFP